MARIPREYHHQMVHFLRKTIGFADDGASRYVGTIPSGALILKPMSGVHVVTVFNAASTNVLDIGTTATADLFGTDLALGTATFVPLDEAIGGYRVAADTDIFAAVATTGGSLTTGDAEVVIAYIPDIDL